MGDGQKTYTFVEKKAASRPEVSAGRSADLSQMAVRHGSWRVHLLAAQHSTGRSGECTDTSVEECPILYPLGFAGQQPPDAYVGERIGERQKAFTVVELMDGLHRNIFATTERGALPDVMTRALQKNFVDALITAAAESEGVK